VTGPVPDWSTQSGFDIRLCWGPVGVMALRNEVSALVIVDVLRFTTALDVATAAGALVFPARWPYEPPEVGGADWAAGTEVADGAGPQGLSLSPATLTALGPGDRIVLPSANGSHCCHLAGSDAVTVVGGCLRNAEAVAQWLLAAHAGPIGVVPCGERWPDGSLRPAVEDLIGAGAIVAALVAQDGAGLTCSPEAAAAGAAFGSTVPDLSAGLAASASGRELAGKGLGDDIVWAADLNGSLCVPVRGAGGAFSAAG
jgi:2-phosphosulfolactate phosphatase